MGLHGIPFVLMKSIWTLLEWFVINLAFQQGNGLFIFDLQYNILVLYTLLYTPRYSWNIAKVGVIKHQSINQSYYTCTYLKIRLYFEKKNSHGICFVSKYFAMLISRKRTNSVIISYQIYDLNLSENDVWRGARRCKALQINVREYRRISSTSFLLILKEWPNENAVSSKYSFLIGWFLWSKSTKIVFFVTLR